MQRLILFDGTNIFYRAFYALPNLTAPSGVPTGAITGFANISLKILREYNPDFAAIALDTSRVTFRTEIFPEYKGGREKTPDELIAQLGILEEFADVLGIKVLTAENFEADDIIGTLAAQASGEFLVDIVSGDRDTFQLINKNTRVLFTKTSSVEIYDEEKFRAEFGFEPALLVDYKALAGDTSDNIPGAAGIGGKTATKLIQEFGALENVLANSDKISSKKFRDAVQTGADMARLSKTLAQIVRDVPNISFTPQSFRITPNLARVDEFCSRYALAVARKRIHEIYDATQNLFASFRDDSTADLLEVPATADFDSEKIFSAQTLTVAGNCVRAGGEIFDADDFQLAEIFQKFSRKIIVHNLKKILHRVEIADVSHFFDVELAAYLLYPEREKYTCAELLMLEFGLRLPDDSSAAQTVALEKLGALYAEKLDAANLSKLYAEMELPLTEVLAKMEMRGVYVDTSRLDEKSAELEARIATIEQSIYELAGESFNINSPKQLAEILFTKLKLPVVTQTKKKTKSGVSTNAEVLETLRGVHPIVEQILNFRTLTKLKSTYLDGIKTLINPKTHRVHTNFNQTVTATGRLSSSDPNLQNIPVRTDEGREIRALFEPGDGYDFLVSADYSQIELRLLAHMSGDENLIDAFLNGQDIHARTAAEVFGVSIDNITPDLRRKAKAVNFGIVYGISDYGLSKDLRIPRREAGEYIQLYFARYPSVKNFLDATIQEAHETGCVTTMFGRRRFLPMIKSANFHQRGLAERMAMNTPIQGSAADIIKLAMIRAEKNLQGLDSRIILQVHDELVVEAKAAELEQVEKILRDAMENVVALKVPLVVDVHCGKNWTEAK
ncbi:MAG: DNA polymerase I [Selenomonadaceae bacterium]|nr:DNA polymerase I [Selenomonadaceae bacterium]